MTRLDLPDGTRLSLVEIGSQAAPTVVYLPGFPDLGSVSAEPLAFHRALAEERHVIALWPHGVDPEGDGEFGAWRSVDDVVFRYAWALDELGLERVDLVGHSIGAWLAAELAGWFPRRVGRLTLMSPAGIALDGEMVADLFLKAQPLDGFHRGELRGLLFADPEGDVATACFPDTPLAIDEEMRRFGMLRFAALIGWSPAYLYDADLPRRLLRARVRALVINGERDEFLGPRYGARYAELLNAPHRIVPAAGHSVQLEQPEQVAGAVREFLATTLG